MISSSNKMETTIYEELGEVKRDYILLPNCILLQVCRWSIYVFVQDPHVENTQQSVFIIREWQAEQEQNITILRWSTGWLGING